MFGILTIGGIDISVVVVAVALLIVFPVQLLLCFKVKNLSLRLVPTWLSTVALGTCFLMLLTAEGWDNIAWLFFMIYSAIFLVASGFGWLVWFITRLLKRH